MPLHPTKAELVRQLAHFIVLVTGMHNHVGNVADYLKDPSFVPTKIRPVTGCTLGSLDRTVPLPILTNVFGFCQILVRTLLFGTAQEVSY
jgi:hypothetical protein